MGKASAPVLFLVGLLVVAAVGGVTFAIASVLEVGDEVDAGGPAIAGTPPEGSGASTTSSTTPLAPDQVEVTGIAVGVTVEGGTIDLVGTPFLIDVAPDGAPRRGAVMTDVEVDGQLETVVWDGGRPFDLQATGLGIVPPQANIFANPQGITVGFVDGAVNGFAEGNYGLQTPVAIGAEGLAQPSDAVAFRASVESTITFHGGATAIVPPRQVTFEARGHVLITGTIEVRDDSGVRTGDQTAVELPDGDYRLTITPRHDGRGYDLECLLQGEGITVT